MRSGIRGNIWRAVLVAAALLATVSALYLQLFERRSRQEEDRLTAARLAGALEASRLRLEAEILAELREELAKGESPGSNGDKPLPDAVLRRSESARERTLEQVRATGSAAEAALDRLDERLDAQARQLDETDRTLRQDLEEARAELRREQGVTGKVVSLLLAAVLCLVVEMAVSLTGGGDPKRGEAGIP